MDISRVVLFFALSIASTITNAGLVTIEPDRFAAGSDLSVVSQHVTLSTMANAPIFSAPVYPRLDDSRPSEVTTTGPLRKNVFSGHQNDNTEWFAWPSYYNIDVDHFDREQWAADEPDAMLITFTNTVSYVSILTAEIFQDAACCSSDPTMWWIYDSSDKLIFNDYLTYPYTPISHLGTYDFGQGPEPAYPVWKGTFAHHDIRRLVIGGESEPTTLDRLQFKTIPVPEPATPWLLVSGLVALAVAKLRRRAAHGGS